MEDAGYSIKGLELCTRYKKNVAEFNGDFLKMKLPNYSFDVITMHDLLEHLVDPFRGLQRCLSLLSFNGILIIDFPNFFKKEGLHHWKINEHLWMFTQDQLQSLLITCGFSILDIYKPIPSKLVFVAEKKVR